VHQIVTQHGGQVFVQSTPGAGTTFHLFFRSGAQAEVSPRSPAAEVPSAWLTIRRVLLVEDEPAVAEGIALLLRSEGVDCFVVERGAEAAEAVRSFSPDLVVLDVGLPDMSGVDVYRQIIRIRADLPTIFSTGHGDHRLLSELPSSARVAFLSKPYDFASLERKAAAVLQQ
jgi:CheY-like chemotaxis protein